MAVTIIDKLHKILHQSLGTYGGIILKKNWDDPEIEEWPAEFELRQICGPNCLPKCMPTCMPLCYPSCRPKKPPACNPAFNKYYCYPS
jgi:hypothetical protein